MADNRSYKVFLLSVESYEFSTPIRSFTRRAAADQEAKRLQKELDEDGCHLQRWTTVAQIDLVTHDGAHAVHADLCAAAGKNQRKKP